MKYSLIKDGVVVNVILASEDFIVGYAQENGYSYVDADQYPDALIGATTTDNVNFDASMYKSTFDPGDPTIEPVVTGMQEI